jgi:serine/threonine protein kinase
MQEIPVDVIDGIRKSGWIPGKRIAEGGGGTVFACFQKKYVDLFDKVIKATPSMLRRNEIPLAIEIGNELLDHFLGLPLIGALKIPHTVTSNEIDKRLTEEIRAMAAFNHPNIMKLLGYDSAMPPRWFIMEYYPKGTLEENLNTFYGKPLSALEALRPIVEGVSLLHRHDPLHVHRDIKPKNIFVSTTGQLVLGDFGIVFTKSDDRTRLTQPGDAAYSRDWIPEWVRHRSPEDFSAKVDVYMLAKVLYYMLANKNVLPSQLDDKDCDLRELFPNVEGIDSVYDLLAACIVSKEASCQPNDAAQFLERIEDSITKLRSKSCSLLFNFLCAKSDGGFNLPKDLGFAIKPLADIQVYIPAPTRRFVAKARVWGPARNVDAEIRFGLGTENSDPIRVGSSTTEPGWWSNEIVLEIKKPLDRGWHTLRVDGKFIQHQTVLTGFMVYAV